MEGRDYDRLLGVGERDQDGQCFDHGEQNSPRREFAKIFDDGEEAFWGDEKAIGPDPEEYYDCHETPGLDDESSEANWSE